ncbi:MAG: hypothetical protein IPL32_14670 [Chloracidobacterium sp.]|nr:hypothetical protein [Chloracidobacterium sp.]
MRHITHKIEGIGFYNLAGIDTAFVLFFLSMEYGRSNRLFSMDSLLIAITMAMLAVLPYFLPSRYEKPQFGNWLIGRTALALFGVVFGVFFKQSVGVTFPESIRFAPMTFLILASMVSCYLQFYGLMKLRLAK